MKTLKFLYSSLMKWGHPADVIADPKEKAEKHRRKYQNYRALQKRKRRKH